MYRDDDLRWFGRTRPAPLPRHYSIARVRKIFKEVYDLDVVKIDVGTKATVTITTPPIKCLIQRVK